MTSLSLYKRFQATGCQRCHVTKHIAYGCTFEIQYAIKLNANKALKMIVVTNNIWTFCCISVRIYTLHGFKVHNSSDGNKSS